MNKNKFLTLLMGEKWYEWSEVQYHGCDFNPDHLSNPLPVIRFMEKEMPEVWNEYVASFMCTVYCDRTIATRALNFILDLNNFILYLSEDREWGSMECEGGITKDGSAWGGIIKHPALIYLEGCDE